MSTMSRKPIIHEITFHAICIINARIKPSVIVPACASDEEIVESKARSPSEMTGEKSIAPNLKIPSREKILR